MSYSATVVLPFGHAAAEVAQKAKGSRLTPQEWREQYLLAQEPKFQEYLRSRWYPEVRRDDSGRLWYKMYVEERNLEEFMSLFEKRIWQLYDIYTERNVIMNWKRT